ncbi:MAG: type II toxin-antitoxin system HipA family toxin YjjJ [Burkholderiales bacterium]|nr:type II toxin-antitoxin system HipA family toxin YjjJ [Burkholderiales bacterium]
MRPRDVPAREGIRATLRLGPKTNRDLERATLVSAATTKRILQELQAEIVSAGQTRQRKHALRRQVRGTMSTLETFVIGEDGRPARGPDVQLVQPSGCYALLDPAVWPQDAAQGGWWDGLPYPLYDMRPQGYLGRVLAQEFAPTLAVPTSPEDWSDDDVLWFLAHHGADTPGNLIVGERAMQLWTRERSELRVIPDRAVKREYVERAQTSHRQAGAGSSAGGEYPKFTAARSAARSLTPYVIVKFSGGENTGPARRWADLLVCEHLAGEVISTLDGHSAARSRIIEAGGRTFLESERFDRHGEHGRSAVVSLSAVEGALSGAGPLAWPAVVGSPAGKQFFPARVRERVEELWWFGRFIANTDMHHANLGLRPRGTLFELAPVYDMLPMRYAPLRGGDVRNPEFAVHDLPMPPRDAQLRWAAVLGAALTFWDEASRDSRISEPFRRACAANGIALLRWSETWAGAQ